MDPEKNEPLPTDPLTECECTADHSDSQNAELEDEMLQQEYRQRHLEQLRRLQCPGCGETDIF